MILNLLVLLVFIGLTNCQPKNNTDAQTNLPPPTYVSGALYLKQSINFQSCSLEVNCPSGLTCAYLDLNSGQQAACVDTNLICEQTGCAEGQCVALQTYPLQIRCQK